METAQEIIQTLLYFGEATSVKDIADFLQIDNEIVMSQIGNVRTALLALGMTLAQSGEKYEVLLSEKISSIVSAKKLENLKGELSESALQTLAVIFYKNNPTKAEIDFIRGVDSGRSLKTLLLRGLVEKIESKNKKTYIPTIETIKYLGLNTKEDILDQEEISSRLHKLIHGDEEKLPTI